MRGRSHADPGHADDSDDWSPLEPVVAPARGPELVFRLRPRPAAVIVGAALAGIAVGMVLGMSVSHEDAATAAADDVYERR